MVLVLYPDSDDGRPGAVLTDRGTRSAFAAGARERIEVHHEYLDISRTTDGEYQRHLAEFQKRKHAGRQIDLILAGLTPALDFALQYRDQIFPGVPVVFFAVDEREARARTLPPDVIGVPIKMDLAATLDLALGLHPDTERVFVVAGKAKFDVQWEAEARRIFRAYEDKLQFVYLTGLPLSDLLQRVSQLPERSIIYYLHVFEDGDEKSLIPAEVLSLIAAKVTVPIYGHVDTYVGRGIVGGRVFSFENEGKNAAVLGLRILAREKPEKIGVQPVSTNTYMFDARQLPRWGISAASLPPGSDIRHHEPTFWDLYRWHILGLISVCVVETLLIVGLLVQRSSRVRAEKRSRQMVEVLRENQRELRELTGRLLRAQETERRRIARELHDDLNQSLALLSVELDMLNQKPPESAAQFGRRVKELSAQVKQLSSTVHDLSHQIHPAKLEQLGLLATVRSLCSELAQSHSLDIAFTDDKVPDEIAADTALCLYRVVQEALQNVIKHSGAKHARVELSGSTDAIGLRIADDGAGFDPSQVDGKGSLGLVSMRERLRLVCGDIVIDSKPADGTRIEVRVPLYPSSQVKGVSPQEPAVTG
jgi:signal transduction histidine kinase